MVVRFRAVGDRPFYYRAICAVRQEGRNSSTPSEHIFPWIVGFGSSPSEKKRHACNGGALLATDSKGFQLPVKGRALHADELGGPRNVAAEPCDLDRKSVV